MSFFKDEYIIEYLLQNGYSEEELMSDSFTWTSLQRDFEMPIDLDRVTNLEELRNFILANVRFEVGRETIESGKLENATHFMFETKLVAKEPGLKLDKIYVNCTEMLLNTDGTTNRIGGLRCELNGFDLENLEITYDTTIGLDKQMDNSDGPYSVPVFKRDGTSNMLFLLGIENDFLMSMPKVALTNCANIDISKMNTSFLTLDNCVDIDASQKANLYELVINKYNGNIDFVNSIDLAQLIINDFEELDLSSLELGEDVDISIENVDKCYLSEDSHFEGRFSFKNVNFENDYSKRAEFDKSITIIDSTISSEDKMLIAQKDLRLEACDIEIIDGVKVSEDLELKDMSVGFEMEGLKKQYGYALKYKEGVKSKDGFDLRRLDKVLNLNLEENKDILENPDLLKLILENNQFLETIQVTPSLSHECKAVLEQYAPDKHYTYEFKNGSEILGVTMRSYGDGSINSQDEIVDFKSYCEADEKFERLLDGMNPEWSDLEKFKYLYNQLGMITSYDVNVLSGNDDLDSHNSANIVARNPFSSILTSRGVCAGIAESYQYLCKKAGLECSMEGSESHRYNIIEYENENGEKVKSYCDLTWDYDYIKRGQKCKYFAKSSDEFKKDHPGIIEKNLDGIDIEKQEEIDREIGYINNEYGVKSYIKMLEPYMEMSNGQDKINIILQKMMELGQLNHMANREVISFAKAVLSTANVSKCGSVDTFIRKKDAVEKETRDILWVEDEERSTDENKEYLYYVFNSEQQAFKSADYELIEELLANGMLEFYADTKLPGFEGWGSEKQMQEKINNRAKSAAQDR